MSISCSKINELAITHGGLFEADVFPTSQVKEDWDVLARQLVDSIKACTDDGAKTVSYTHLDVYKRQI